MSVFIEAEKPPASGIYDTKIAQIDTREGKFGTRLRVLFDLLDGRSVSGFFPPKATPNNKTGRLFERALGEIRAADSDELLGKTVKVLVEHNHRDGQTYANVVQIV